jgi:hypothetical protein
VLLVGNKVKCNFKENAENVAKYLKGQIDKWLKILITSNSYVLIILEWFV